VKFPFFTDQKFFWAALKNCFPFFLTSRRFLSNGFEMSTSSTLLQLVSALVLFGFGHNLARVNLKFLISPAAAAAAIL
jgi:hypothetical protein